MRFARVIGLAALPTLLGFLLGCGNGKPTDNPALGPGSIPAPNPGPGPNPQQKDLYEIDPDKHVIPAAPVGGRLGGRPFTPDRVELEGNKLSFRQGKDFFADLSIDIFLHGSGNASEGLKLVVRPSQKWTDNIPALHVSTRQGDDLPKTKFVNDDYALTLELGRAEKGKSAGKIYLCLPDTGRSYLAGTFTAERKRTLSDPPGDEEVPFIRGSVTPPVKKEQTVWVGYVGLPAGGKVISDSAGGQAFGDEGDGGGVRSTSFAPRTASVRFEKFTPRFDFTNLPPGRYLLFARVKGGPAAWNWVEVAAGGRVNADLKLDEKNVGTVEVKLAPGQNEVRLVPADLGSPPPGEDFRDALAFSLDLRAEAKDGKAVVEHVPAGKYQVRAGRLRADVEVTAGKTATVELKSDQK